MALLIGAGRYFQINPTIVKATSSSLFICEVYGGGGSDNNGLKYDFVELYNISSSDINLAGWSLQFASDNSANWSVVSLSGSIISSTHYLIQLTGGNKGDALPLPDLVGSLTLDATSGKLALLDTTTKVGKYHDPRDDPNVGINVIDFVGYGSADASETAPAGSPSTTSSIQRSSLIDTDDNSADFIVGSYTPFNSAISVASYIMTAPDSPYDTGQCDMTFPIARNRVTSLTSSQLDYFKTSSETASAKLRYEAWATNQGVSDPYVAESIQPYALITFKDKVTAFSVYASVITLVSGYFLVKRKRLRQ